MELTSTNEPFGLASRYTTYQMKVVGFKHLGEKPREATRIESKVIKVFGKRCEVRSETLHRQK